VSECGLTGLAGVEPSVQEILACSASTNNREWKGKRGVRPKEMAHLLASFFVANRK